MHLLPPVFTIQTGHLYQVRNDFIRFRYGNEQHLDEALKRIFQYGLVSSRLYMHLVQATLVHQFTFSIDGRSAHTVLVHMN